MNTDLQKHTPANLSWFTPNIDYQRFSRRAARLRSEAFTSSWTRFGGVLKRALQTWSEWQHEKRAVAELKRLNQRELRDLGLYPGDLDRLQQGGLTTSAISAERPSPVQRERFAMQPNLRLIAKKSAQPHATAQAQDLRKCG